jgi:RNA polymerase sigma-70 factor, ECF subfamily
MSSRPPEASPDHADLPGAVRRSWQVFLDGYEPLRADLYRYCRYLTASPWDAEDLVQDTLLRAFVTLGMLGAPPQNPRAWLFRVASNAWIDEARKRRPVPEPEPVLQAPEPRAPREAAGTLMTRVSPQERAAVVLKDVFDFSLEEVAAALGTSVGAVKAALHRGRGKLLESASEAPSAPVPAVLDAFCAAFNARDLERLTALLLDSASVEVVGVTTEYGPHGEDSRVLHGMLYGAERLARADTLGGIEARFMQGVRAAPPRAEAREHRGEWIILLHYAHSDGDAVRGINRLSIDGDRITRLRNYFFTPDAIAEVCRELDVRARSNGYRYYLTGC